MADDEKVKNDMDDESLGDAAEDEDEDENEDEDGGDDYDDDDDDDEDDDDDDDHSEAIAGLEQQLVSMPADYAVHIKLISLRKAGADLDGVRAARERMAAVVSPSEQAWCEWIDDEERLADSLDELEALLKLCTRARDEQLSIQLWLRSIRTTMRIHTPDLVPSDDADDEDRSEMMEMPTETRAVRDVFECALTAGGLHVAEGGKLWQAAALPPKIPY